MDGITLPILGDFQRILALRHTDQPVSSMLGSPPSHFFTLGQQRQISAHHGRICGGTPDGQVNRHIFAGNRELAVQPSRYLRGDLLVGITVRQLNGNRHELRNRHIMNDRRAVLTGLAHIKGIGLGVRVGALFVSCFLVFELCQSFADGKLLKQLWTLGIRDKRLLCVLSKMLKAPVQGEGVPTKGVPQGGILSPLLANVVLNELDWWVSSQWDTFPLKKRYQSRPYYKGSGNMKPVYLVRYADDFKLFCKTRGDAQRLFEATKLWLKERLGLEISPEKSKIVNLKKRYSDFLGFKLKLRQKSGKWILKSHISDKANEKCRQKIRDAIALMGRKSNQWSVMRFNAAILGLHQYYKVATNVYLDFDKIAFDVRKMLLCRTKAHRSKHGRKSEAFQQYYGEFTGRILNVESLALYPINGIKTSPPMCFSQNICNYTASGREKIHEMQKAVSPHVLQYLMENPIRGQSTELNDNRISLYVAQRGKCAVCKEPLQLWDMEVHHLTPKFKGGKDEYSNLVFVTKDVHKIIHARRENRH